MTTQPPTFLDFSSTHHRSAFESFLVEDASDAILVRDLEDRILYWNGGAERLYGWRFEDVAGCNVYDILSQRDLRPSQDRRRTLEDAGTWTGELCQRTRDGREITVESRWRLLRSADGLPEAVLMVNRDITERKAIEHRLLQAQRMETACALSGGVVHDVQNALSQIALASKSLQEEFANGVSGTQYLEALRANATYAGRLTAWLLGFAKGVEDRSPAVDLGALIAESEEILRLSFPRSIRIGTSVDPDLWPVAGSAVNLQQVIMNLAVNARAAMPHGGALSISASNILADGVRCVRLGIADTGIGIRAEAAKEIMRPFFTTKESGEGNGLGLFVVAKIVRDHDGILKVFDNTSQGARFEIDLPASR